MVLGDTCEWVVQFPIHTGCVCCVVTHTQVENHCSKGTLSNWGIDLSDDKTLIVPPPTHSESHKQLPSCSFQYVLHWAQVLFKGQLFLLAVNHQHSVISSEAGL